MDIVVVGQVLAIKPLQHSKAHSFVSVIVDAVNGTKANITFWNDKSLLLDGISEGDSIAVAVEIKGRENAYNDKIYYHHDFSGWAVKKLGEHQRVNTLRPGRFSATQKEKVEPYVKRDTPIDGAGIKIEDNLPFS